ncbi:MAG: metal-dependent phosphohydrolase [Chryseobacterium sp.]|nr:MAG: metal-dependent phosphohydrolase [Chryseobacterium sp.]
MMRSERQTNLLNFVTVQHGEQKRKYTGEPYTVHLVAVAECAEQNHLQFGYEIGLCHDLFEDTACTDQQLRTALQEYGYNEKETDFILEGTWDLTDKFISADYPNFNRKQRKAMEVERLETISPNSQSIKYCDLIDNTKSIVQHDKNFARVYLQEKANLLKVMNKGDRSLYDQAVKNTLR